MKTPFYVIINLYRACRNAYHLGGETYFWHNLSCELRSFGLFNGNRDWADQFLFGLGVTLMGRQYAFDRLIYWSGTPYQWDSFEEQYLSSWFPSVRSVYKARKAAQKA